VIKGARDKATEELIDALLGRQRKRKCHGEVRSIVRDWAIGHGCSISLQAVERVFEAAVLHAPADFVAWLAAKKKLGSKQALRAACMRGQADVVAVLLDALYDPSERDRHGLTPLITNVIWYGPEAAAVTKRLLARGADVAAKDSFVSCRLPGVLLLHRSLCRAALRWIWLCCSGAARTRSRR
jgi:hypothetical protein